MILLKGENNMSRYDEDFADNIINSSKLKALFNMDTPKDVSTTNEPDIPHNDPIDTQERRDPDTIIYNNIDRAERFLDKIEEEVNNGSVNARMMEVASALINSITQASASIVGSNQYSDEMLYKERVLALKEREVMVKEALGKGGSNKITNNVLVTSREDLLKMINGNNEQNKVVTSG